MIRDEPSLSLASPAADATTSSRPLLQWEALPYPVSGYRVEVARLSALAWSGPEYWEWAANTGATSIRTDLLAPGDYRWRVMRTAAMYFQADGSGQWSTGTFTVAGDPVPRSVSPASGASVRADDVVFTWEPYAATHELTVMVGSTPEFGWDDAIYRAYVVSTAHAVTAMLPTGDLYWKVCDSFDCAATSLIHVTPAPGADVTAPISSLTAVTPRLGASIGTTGATSVYITWMASDTDSGIAAQEVQIRRGTGAWTKLPVLSTSRSVATWLTPGSAYAIRTRATDRAGNVGSWASTTVQSTLRQENSTVWSWTSGWTRSTATGASGGSTRWATRTGASGTITVNGRSIALVAPRSTTGGSAQVSIDGVPVGSFRLDTSPIGARRVVFVQSWPVVGTHRVTIKVLGTNGHPRIDVDAVVILK